jgi:hypothetical protein
VADMVCHDARKRQRPGGPSEPRGETGRGQSGERGRLS